MTTQLEIEIMVRRLEARLREQLRQTEPAPRAEPGRRSWPVRRWRRSTPLCRDDAPTLGAAH